MFTATNKPVGGRAPWGPSRAGHGARGAERRGGRAALGAEARRAGSRERLWGPRAVCASRARGSAARDGRREELQCVTPVRAERGVGQEVSSTIRMRGSNGVPSGRTHVHLGPAGPRNDHPPSWISL